MERVTGIGGVFLRSRNPAALVAWYAEHLGVPVTDGYVIFPESRNTVWSPFLGGHRILAVGKAGDGELTVRDLDAMLAQLRAAGVDHEYGRFGWGLDPEGNRFELWEPLPEGSPSA